ncbi:hypothetical protein [Kibdelosporangium phytohabitans]|uniref:Uncharacterized protein n=1 Tax=Kibdelosporangium phytohabitans TaxID=860235 RepID=A0A0N9IBK5_9PSEU|nr:hypothetical protein [Kibdelosporangium phytohabitans]ALG13698.1 hypothetical protein AOZ06_48665 [Kibdelosporangium phytohabitans]MBE1465587.1 hypothetical protein [Kibdelosporangium phytohabitans]
MTTVDKITELIAAMLTESHGIAAIQRGDVVELPELSLRVKVDKPIWHHEDRLVQLPIGIGDPEWSALAWDQAVGVAGEDTPPLAQALLAWVHHVLPLFIALRDADNPLAHPVFRMATKDAAGAETELLAAPVMMRMFGRPGPSFQQVLADDPPSLLVAERLLRDTELTGQPTWLYTMSGMAEGEAVKDVTVNNVSATEDFPGFDAVLDWGDASGTVKSWVVLRRRV